MARLPSSPSRRTVLRTSGVALAAGLAGCSEAIDTLGAPASGGGSGSGGGDGGSGDGGGDSGGGSASTPDPDAGRDSYGVLLRNTTKNEQEVTVLVRLPWEEKTVFEKTVTVEPGGTREWNSVMTKEKEYAVTGRVAVNEPALDRTEDTENRWVKVGAEETPPASNIIVEVETIEYEEYAVNASESNTYDIPAVWVMWPREYRDDG